MNRNAVALLAALLVALIDVALLVLGIFVAVHFIVKYW